jgi:acyl dehydratase
MHTMKYFEDAAEGDTFVSRSPYRVTAEEIKSFAAQWDPQRYHLDEAEAQKVVGQLFAPALLTLCISFKLTHDSGYFEIVPAAGLGIEEIRIPKPVFVNDELQATVTVVAKRESQSRPGLGLLSHKTDVCNQHGELVLSYVVPSLVYKRPR